MSRLCVLFDVACVVCGAKACCVDRCAECVCMECWSLAVYSLHCWTHPNKVRALTSVSCVSRLLYKLFEVDILFVCTYIWVCVYLDTSVHVSMLCNHIIIQSSPKHHCVQYLYNTFTEHAVGLCRMCLLLYTVCVCICVSRAIHTVLHMYVHTVPIIYMLYCTLSLH